MWMPHYVKYFELSGHGKFSRKSTHKTTQTQTPTTTPCIGTSVKQITGAFLVNWLVMKFAAEYWTKAIGWNWMGKFHEWYSIKCGIGWSFWNVCHFNTNEFVNKLVKFSIIIWCVNVFDLWPTWNSFQTLSQFIIDFFRAPYHFQYPQNWFFCTQTPAHTHFLCAAWALVMRFWPIVLYFSCKILGWISIVAFRIPQAISWKPVWNSVG